MDALVSWDAVDVVVSCPSLHRCRGVQLNAPTMNIIVCSALDNLVNPVASESLDALGRRISRDKWSQIRPYGHCSFVDRPRASRGHLASHLIRSPPFIRLPTLHRLNLPPMPKAPLLACMFAPLIVTFAAFWR